MQVIESFVVELGLDPSKFTAGQRATMAAFQKTREEAERTGKDIEAQGRKTNEFFSGLKRQALELTAIFLGGRGIKEFVSYITQADAATGRMARTVGQSVGELSMWQGAFQRVGGSAQDAVASMDAIQSSMEKARITSHVPDFARYIGGIFDKTGRLKEAATVFKQLADLVHGMDPALAKAFLNEIAPGMNPAAIQLIISGRNEIERLEKTMRGIGSATKADTDAAIKLQTAWTQLMQIGENFGRSLLTKLSPALQGVLGLTSYFLAKLSNKLFDTPMLEAPKESHALDRYGKAISSIESGGNYQAIGPLTKNGDRAYGKYQVMGANIPQWTKDATGTAMTPAEFLASKEAQEAVFRHKFGELLQKYGNPQDAAAAWHSGRPLAEAAAAGAHDGNTSTVDYVRRFNEAFNAQTPVGPEPPKGFRPTQRSRLGTGEEADRMRQMIEGGGKLLDRMMPYDPAAGDRVFKKGDNTTTTTVTVGSINLPNVGDADAFARELPGAIRRVGFASGANSGLV